MKLDIKSVVIGLLLGFNIMLLMWSAPLKNEVGRYQFEIFSISSLNFGIGIMDTTTGKFVKSMDWLEIDEEIKNNPNRLKK